MANRPQVLHDLPMAIPNLTTKPDSGVMAQGLKAAA
jgi:hypothetical protein